MKGKHPYGFYRFGLDVVLFLEPLNCGHSRLSPAANGLRFKILIGDLPFFPQVFPSLQWTYLTALGMALIALFGLGAFLGHVSRRNVVIYGLRTVIAGVISILISLLLGGSP